MKKKMCIVLSLLLLCALAACGQRAPETAPTPEPTVTPVPAMPTPVPTATPVIIVENTPAPQGEWAQAYRSYLLEHFEGLSRACYGFVAGVGFMDLDLDTVPELLLFDAGASSSMGVQFFDLVEGRVECVSASSVDVGVNYGGEYYAPGVYVNTTDFRAFRLAEGADGSLYFHVTSHNGAEDFRYSELVRFGSADGVLTLQSLACSQTSVDPETQETRYTVYTRGDAPITQAEYEAVLADTAAAADLGYEGAGALIWENAAYGQGLAGFTAMLDAAISAYVPAL